MPANLENAAVTTGLEKSVFTSVPKKRQCQRILNHTIALISHASKGMLKILQARLQQYVNCEFPDVQAVLEKAEEPEIKLPTPTRSSKKQAFDCVDHNKLWKILTEMGIPDHLTSLLRNLYAGQEARQRLELNMQQQAGSK